MTGEELLQFYNKEWEEYRFSAKVVDGIFSYLNRHWIKREMDEGNEAIYIIYVVSITIRSAFDSSLLTVPLHLSAVPCRLERCLIP